jgi:hypothetical protein
MIQTLITSLLEIHASTWVSAVLLNSDDEGVRVFHQRIPMGQAYTGGVVIYNVLDQSPEYRKGGMCLQEYSVTFTVYASTDVEADTIADNLITLLEGWEGESGGKTWKYTLLERKVEGFNDDQRLCSKIVDFLFARDN